MGETDRTDEKVMVELLRLRARVIELEGVVVARGIEALQNTDGGMDDTGFSDGMT